MNSFLGLVHTACHTTRAHHAQNGYLNPKEGEEEKP